jgi:hypothetical protein
MATFGTASVATGGTAAVAASGNGTASSVVSASRDVETTGPVGVGPKKEVSIDTGPLFPETPFSCAERFNGFTEVTCSQTCYSLVKAPYV